VLDDLEVAVEEIDPLTLDRQLAAAVSEPSPVPRLDHGALETERPHVLGADRVAVVEPEPPFTVRLHKAARVAEGHCHDSWDLDQLFCELAHPNHSSARERYQPSGAP
jgi:hypothetical protein